MGGRTQRPSGSSLNVVTTDLAKAAFAAGLSALQRRAAPAAYASLVSTRNAGPVPARRDP